ncbi:hypothetical protein TNCV_2236301 [Trichonephila clavipes]|nr:hypothetical protein TNCV_2236301 [Trichonephila clavipes]
MEENNLLYPGLGIVKCDHASICRIPQGGDLKTRRRSEKGGSALELLASLVCVMIREDCQELFMMNDDGSCNIHVYKKFVSFCLKYSRRCEKKR